MNAPPKSALLIVDVQNDFFAKGSLAIPNAERILAALNRYLDDATTGGLPVYASRDWHPATTLHFRQFGGPWPTHCVQDTNGASFHPGLRLPADIIVVTKGVERTSHGYSAFEGRVADGTPFLMDLRARDVQHLFVAGLATDYCVKNSVLDALSAGIKVTVLEDAVAGVDAADSARALVEMREHGAQICTGWVVR